VAAEASPGPPLFLSEQGQLVSHQDIPVYDLVNMTFRLYATPTGGIPLWQESHAVVPDDGFFHVMLGGSAPLDLGYINGAPLYLGIQVNDDAEMSPREEFASVPYALLANNVTGDITPNSVIVNGVTVINSMGQWVGPSVGLAGPAGPPGPEGTPGAQGPAGPAGLSVVASNLPAGSAPCPYGGTQFVNGTTTAFACNGAPGTAGPAGAQGPAGQSVTETVLTAGDTHCPNGGAQLVEGNVTAYVCTGNNGTQGIAGPAGADGQSVTVSPVFAGDPNCPNGGTEFISGTTVSYACNGASGAQGSIGPAGPQGVSGAIGPQGLPGADGLSVVASSLPPGDPNCPSGGSEFINGTTVTFACNGAAGSAGLPGAQGPQGIQGIQGPAGAAGPAGLDGTSVVATTLAPGNPICPNGGTMFVDGATTSYVCNGVDGVSGPQGVAGPQGPPGTAGQNGLSVLASTLQVGDPNCPNGGSEFIDGTTVTFACNGAVGVAGTPGAQGPQGIQGPAGAAGPAGLDGTSVVATSIAPGNPICSNGGTMFVDGTVTTYACNGIDGVAGPQGIAGPQGVQGPQGLIGPTGSQGPQGQVGPVGATGATGPQGTVGPAGAQGPQGVAGAVGPQGPTGSVGATGATGPQGAAGPAGVQGPQGVAGAVGPQGATGPVGATGTAGISVVATALPPGDPNCPTGGTRLVNGGTTTYVCNGAVGTTGIAGATGMIGGTGATGPQGPSGITSVTTCPSGYTAVLFPHSTLCIRLYSFTMDWYTADLTCNTSFGGNMCSHEQLQRACANAGFTPTPQAWLRDRFDNDVAMVTLDADCTDFLHSSSVNATRSTQPNVYCCLEWMSYQ
jgi:hypothetical protein